MLDFERNLENFLDEVLDRLDGYLQRLEMIVKSLRLDFIQVIVTGMRLFPSITNIFKVVFTKLFIKNSLLVNFIRGLFWCAWNSDPNFCGTDYMRISPQYKMSGYVIEIIMMEILKTLNFQIVNHLFIKYLIIICQN